MGPRLSSSDSTAKANVSTSFLPHVRLTHLDRFSEKGVWRIQTRDLSVSRQASKPLEPLDHNHSALGLQCKYAQSKKELTCDENSLKLRCNHVAVIVSVLMW